MCVTSRRRLWGLTLRDGFHFETVEFQDCRYEQTNRSTGCSIDFDHHPTSGDSSRLEFLATRNNCYPKRAVC